MKIMITTKNCTNCRLADKTNVDHEIDGTGLDFKSCMVKLVAEMAALNDPETKFPITVEC